jgi:peptidoglycan/LPS O-acetylase OafA/YrhL
VTAPGRDRPADAVPDVVAPPPKHPRFPLSDGARGMAAVAIMVGHVWLFTGMFGGFTESFPASIPNRAIVRWDGLIAVFFGLSAFLLYRPMIAHRAGGPGRPKVAAYGVARVLRLYPAYWLALTALAIFPGLFGVFSENWWQFYSLTDFLDLNNSHAVCPGIIQGVDQFTRCGLPQSWSLGVEMTFYFALPFYAGLTALLARGRSVRSWMRLELGLLAVLAALSLFLSGPPFNLDDETWFKFSLAGHFYWLALGLALALLSTVYGSSNLPRLIRAFSSRPGACWAGALAIYVLTIFAFYPAPFPVFPYKPAQFAGLIFIQGVGAMLLLIPVAFSNPNRGLPARVLGNPVLMWMGVISYGIALWHVTIIVNLGYAGAQASFVPVLAATVLLTIPLAALSYYVIERPLMRFKYRSPRDVLRGGGRRARRPIPDAGRSG